MSVGDVYTVGLRYSVSMSVHGYLSVCLSICLFIGLSFLLPGCVREKGEEREKKGERVKARERKREREERGEGHRRKGKEGAERRLIEIW